MGKMMGQQAVRQQRGLVAADSRGADAPKSMRLDPQETLWSLNFFNVSAASPGVMRRRTDFEGALYPSSSCLPLRLPTGLCRCRRRLDQPDERHDGPDDIDDGTDVNRSQVAHPIVVEMSHVVHRQR